MGQMGWQLSLFCSAIFDNVVFELVSSLLFIFDLNEFCQFFFMILFFVILFVVVELPTSNAKTFPDCSVIVRNVATSITKRYVPQF